MILFSKNEKKINTSLFSKSRRGKGEICENDMQIVDVRLHTILVQVGIVYSIRSHVSLLLLIPIKILLIEFISPENRASQLHDFFLSSLSRATNLFKGVPYYHVYSK